MIVRLVAASILGVLAIVVGALLRVVSFGATDVGLFLSVGGATVLVGIALGVAIYAPVIRTRDSLRASRSSSFVWVAQRGPGFVRAFEQIVTSETPAPMHMVIVSSPAGVEVWRSLPRAMVARIDRPDVVTATFIAGAPRARLALEVVGADRSVVSLELIPSSDRSGVFPAEPGEVQTLLSRVKESLG